MRVKPSVAFFVHIPLYEGDTFSRIVDRIRRQHTTPGKGYYQYMIIKHTIMTSSPPLCPILPPFTHKRTCAGTLQVQLLPSVGDRSSPTGIGDHTTFIIDHNRLCLTDPRTSAEPIPLGTLMEEKKWHDRFFQIVLTTRLLQLIIGWLTLNYTLH